MPSKRPTYCWDTSVFLAWLGAEATAPLGDVQLVVDEIDGGRAVLLAPVTAYVEILDAKHTPDQMDRFRKFLDRSNVVVADTTRAIAEKGRRDSQPVPPGKAETVDQDAGRHFPRNGRDLPG